ncbi:MAG TPA: hypothetical protein EYP90_01890, partial [Chromatiaceae bacterium]|nr:hypothetical protein [Chromatiaceae bacterium]
MRLDQALACLFGDYSRARLQAWIREGRVLVDGQPRRPRDKVLAGEQVELVASLQQQPPCRPQNIPLKILHQDEHLLVIDKPAGLVVHPGAGNPAGTLLNGLLHYIPELANLPRSGILVFASGLFQESDPGGASRRFP